MPINLTPIRPVIVVSTRTRKRRIYKAVLGADGIWHRYLNADNPSPDLSEAVCPSCRLAYSHVARARAHLCNECVSERIAAEAQRVQEEMDVNLGWVKRDPISDRFRYGYRDPINMAMRDAW